MPHDWLGRPDMIHTNMRNVDSADRDYYATDPIAVFPLLDRFRFTPTIWEPAVGGGHIADALTYRVYRVFASDIVDRGYPGTHIYDFLSQEPAPREVADCDIITNPPYKFAQQFVERAMERLSDGRSLAMLLKLTFLEGAERFPMFQRYAPTDVLVFSRRVCCGKNGIFDRAKNAVAYAWFVWKKGCKSFYMPTIDWISPEEVKYYEQAQLSAPVN